MMTVLPQGWAVIYGFGIRQLSPGVPMILANVALGQDDLETAEDFSAYLDSQVKMIQDTLDAPKIAGPQPTAFPGSDEARLMLVRHTPPGIDPVIHVQTYVRIGTWVGIITLTSSEDQLRTVRPYSDQFVQGLHILPFDPQLAPPPPPAPYQG
jgi:hypothetical protein